VRRIPSTALAENQISGEADGDQGTGSEEGSQRDKVKPAECGCGRRMRMAPSVLAKGPVTCGNCGADFLVDRDATKALGDEDRVSNDFVNRRAAQLKAVDAAGSQVALLTEAASTAAGLDDLLRLGTWRGSLNTDAEQPIIISDEAGRSRWDALARAVLIVDGSIDGPALAAREGLELRAGDQVLVASPTGDPRPDLPDDGALGVVTLVDPDSGTATVDFATAGSFVVRAGSGEAAALAYSYCELVRLIPPTQSTAPTPSRAPEAASGAQPHLDAGMEL